MKLNMKLNMKLKKLLPILFAAIFVFATTVTAQDGDITLRFGWSAYPPGEATGFNIYMDTSADLPVWTTTDTTLVLADVPAPDASTGCHNYWIVAFNDTAFSKNSDVVTYCPGQDPDPTLPDQPPSSVPGFNIQIIVTPTNN